MKTVKQRMLDAEVKGSKALADANAAKEVGNERRAERLYASAQKWLDEYHRLEDLGIRDKLADSAMVGILSGRQNIHEYYWYGHLQKQHWTPSQIAIRSGEIADAMMAERRASRKIT